MINLLEALMIFCWGLSWPVSIRKSWVSRTAKGKSVVFEVFIWFGYVCGIVRKFLQISQGGEFDWLFYLGFIFYFLNIIEVSIDMCLWFRNRRLDREMDKNQEKCRFS
ncbi:MAG: hypothetical protein K6G01_10725 [Eubacterium sp.]|nr:hypothetical protein [Eubacterium sp.]